MFANVLKLVKKYTNVVFVYKFWIGTWKWYFSPILLLIGINSQARGINRKSIFIQLGLEMD